jgi:hypothetical protein
MGYPNFVDSQQNLSMRRAAMYCQLHSRVDNALIYDYYNGVPGTSSVKTAALLQARSINEVGISASQIEDILNNDTTLSDEGFSGWVDRNIKSATLPGDANKFMIYFDWRNYSAGNFNETLFAFRVNTIGSNASNATVFDSIQIGDLLNDPICAGGLAKGPFAIPDTGSAFYSRLYSARTWADHNNLGGGEVAQAGRFYDIVSGYNSYIEDSFATGLPQSFSVDYEFESGLISYAQGTGDESGIWKPSARGMTITITLLLKPGEDGLVGNDFAPFGWSGDWYQENGTIHPATVPSRVIKSQSFIFPIYTTSQTSKYFNSSDTSLTMANASLGRTTLTFGPAVGGFNIEDYYDPYLGCWAYPEIASSFANPLLAASNGTGYKAHHFGVGVETLISYF